MAGNGDAVALEAERQVVEATERYRERPPEPALVARVAPAALDPTAVARAAASFGAEQRLRALLDQVMRDVDDDEWSPAAADLDDLRERLESAWRGWRRPLGRAS